MIKGIIRSTKLANHLKAREGQGMKRFEIDLSDGKITIRKEREERLTANQRFYIIITSICSGSVIGFFALIFWILR